MNQVTFDVVDPSTGLTVNVTVTEITAEDGSTALSFSLDVDESTGVLGELNGVFFDLSTIVEKNSLTTDAIMIKSDEGDVSNLGGGINVNGDVVKEYDEFDAGVVVDETGLSGSYNDGSYDFTVALDGGDLTLDMLLGQDFALRLTSVGEDGSQNGSLKLGATVPETPDDDGDGGGGTDGGVIYEALDDFIFASETDSFDGVPEYILDNAYDSVLADDTEDGAAYTGTVWQDGAAIEAPITLVGDNGGLLMVYPDGSVDFSANADFDYLAQFELTQTAFTYDIAGGASAQVVVQVEGIDDGGVDLGDPGGLI